MKKSLEPKEINRKKRVGTFLTPEIFNSQTLLATDVQLEGGRHPENNPTLGSLSLAGKGSQIYSAKYT